MGGTFWLCSETWFFFLQLERPFGAMVWYRYFAKARLKHASRVFSDVKPSVLRSDNRVALSVYSARNEMQNESWSLGALTSPPKVASVVCGVFRTQCQLFDYLVPQSLCSFLAMLAHCASCALLFLSHTIRTRVLSDPWSWVHDPPFPFSRY